MSIELEDSGFEVRPPADARMRMDEPLPVSLEAVADMRLPKPAGDALELDWLYVDVLEFRKATDRPEFAYHAENFDLVFDLEREGGNDYRPVKVIGRSLVDIERKLVEAEVEHSRQKGLLPGQEAIVMQDSEGNWLEIREHREVG